jgi:3-methyladenine DNA glycosylase AlkD
MKIAHQGNTNDVLKSAIETIDQMNEDNLWKKLRRKKLYMHIQYANLWSIQMKSFIDQRLEDINWIFT